MFLFAIPFPSLFDTFFPFPRLTCVCVRAQYVPYHSARIEHCPAAAADPVWGPIYAEMVDALLGPTATADASVNFTRLDVSFVKHHHGRIDAFIGRAAHISFLDQEPFIWQFVAMCKRFFE